MSGSSSYIHVAVAAIVNSDNEVLISQRKQGTHLGGYWEFPGGKLEQGESISAALLRELEEELAIRPVSSRPLIRARYRYPEKSVLLDVWKIDAWSGIPRGVEGQRIAWRPLDQLDAEAFPPADIPVINALKLPASCLITGTFSSLPDFEQKLSTALRAGIELVQLRLTRDWLAANGRQYAAEIIDLCARLCKRQSVRLVFNVPEDLELPAGAAIHLNSRRLLDCDRRPATELASASCHNRQELEHAEAIGVDFAFLSPVQSTRSHPDARPLGWEAFHELVDRVNIPVYALGGLSPVEMEAAWNSGAQGIAAIGAFWK